MDSHTFCRQRDSFGGGYLRGYDNFPANENGGGFVHPLCFRTIASVGDATVCAQSIAIERGYTDLYSSYRIAADNIVGCFCSYDEWWQVVDLGDAHGNKSAQHLARLAGTEVL